MKNPMHNIDDMFYKGIQDHSEHPHEQVWNNIEAELDKDVASAYKRKYKKVKRTASLLLILLAGFVTYEAVSIYQSNELAAKEKITTNSGASSHGASRDKLFSGSNEDNSASTLLSLMPYTETTSIARQQDAREVEDLVQVKNVFADQVALVNSTNQPYEYFTSNDFDNDEITLSREFDPATTSVESITKNIALKADYSPVNILSVSTIAVPKRVVALPKSGKGFYVTAYFSPGMSWNTISNETHTVSQTRPRRNNGNNGSGAGPVVGGNINVNPSGGSTGSNGGGSRGNVIDFNDSETGSYVISGGLKLGYSFSKVFSVETGINYLQSTTSTKPRVIYAEKSDNGKVGYRLDCSSGYSYLLPKTGSAPNAGDSALASDSRNVVNYVGVPLNVRYKVLSAGKFEVTASAGAQINILTGAKANTTIGKGTANETELSSNTEGLRPTYYSATAAVEAEWRLSNRLSLLVSPAGQFGLNSVNESASLNTRPNYFSVATGLKLRL